MVFLGAQTLNRGPSAKGQIFSQEQWVSEGEEGTQSMHWQWCSQAKSFMSNCFKFFVRRGPLGQSLVQM